MHKAIFLDRDGVINRKAKTDNEYVTCWKEMIILSGVPEAIALLNRSGFHVVVVTNQRAVAKGLISIADLESIHHRMCEYLASRGASVDAVYYCPHELQPPCECRKPAPGMLFEAARTHNINLAASWMIGDSERDVQAGVSAGCRTARVVATNRPIESKADIVANSLLGAIHKILDVRSQHSTNKHRRSGSSFMRSLKRL
jgi:D-glycero-D-manno-heptose 1,7-bisphosphate phosphatase